MTPPLFLGIISFFIVASPIVYSQKYPDFWEFPKFMTHTIFGNYIDFRRCIVNSSFPKIAGFLGIPKIHDTPSIFGNYLTFQRCSVNRSFPKILGFLGIPKIHDTPSIFGNYLTFQRCTVNSSFRTITGFLGNKEKKRLNNKTNNIYFYIVFCLYLWAFSFPKINESFC